MIVTRKKRVLKGKKINKTAHVLLSLTRRFLEVMNLRYLTIFWKRKTRPYFFIFPSFLYTLTFLPFPPFLSSPLHLSFSPSLHFSRSVCFSSFPPSTPDSTCIWEGILGIPDMPVVWMDSIHPGSHFQSSLFWTVMATWWMLCMCSEVWVFLVCMFESLQLARRYIICALRAQPVGVNIMATAAFSHCPVDLIITGALEAWHMHTGHKSSSQSELTATVVWTARLLSVKHSSYLRFNGLSAFCSKLKVLFFYFKLLCFNNILLCFKDVHLF